MTESARWKREPRRRKSTGAAFWSGDGNLQARRPCDLREQPCDQAMEISGNSPFRKYLTAPRWFQLSSQVAQLYNTLQAFYFEKSCPIVQCLVPSKLALLPPKGDFLDDRARVRTASSYAWSPDTSDLPSPTYNPTIAKDPKRIAAKVSLSDLVLKLVHPFHPELSPALCCSKKWLYVLKDATQVWVDGALTFYREGLMKPQNSRTWNSPVPQQRQQYYNHTNDLSTLVHKH
jgi:hypothetical protein